VDRHAGMTDALFTRTGTRRPRPSVSTTRADARRRRNCAADLTRLLNAFLLRFLREPLSEIGLDPLMREARLQRLLVVFGADAARMTT